MNLPPNSSNRTLLVIYTYLSYPTLCKPWIFGSPPNICCYKQYLYEHFLFWILAQMCKSTDQGVELLNCRAYKYKFMPTCFPKSLFLLTITAEMYKNSWLFTSSSTFGISDVLMFVIVIKYYFIMVLICLYLIANEV